MRKTSAACSLVVFDVDGTLISVGSYDWTPFGTALAAHTGTAEPEAFWHSLPDVTAGTVVRAATVGMEEKRRASIEFEIQKDYLRGLQMAAQRSPWAFKAAPGAAELLSHLPAAGIAIAIATGDWHPTINFKLGMAGLDVSKIPMATSSDRSARADIIALAAQRAGHPLSSTLYVGDGVWDYRACQRLGIPFIGTGDKTERLREIGAAHISTDLFPETFLPVLERALRPKLP